MRRLFAKAAIAALVIVGAAGPWSPADAHECISGRPGTPSCIPDTTH